MKIFHTLLIIALSLNSTLSAQSIDYPPPGKLIDNGGYKMHLLIEGESKEGPTIVFFHGAGDIALNWNLVLPGVGKFAKAVAIDQNGEGWSDHGHGMSLYQQVYDSHEVLKKAGLKAPYILVGHSLGGIIANLFAVKYRDETAGVIMVDATHPDVVLKIYNPETQKMEWKKMRLTAKDSIPPVNTSYLTSPKKTSSFQPRRDFGEMLDKFSKRDQKLFNWIYNQRPWTYVKGQGKTYEAEIFQQMHDNSGDYSLGETPLIVITGGNKTVPEGDDNWSQGELIRHSTSIQKDLLNLSTNSRQIIAENSGHNIPIDEPELIVITIQQLMNQINKVSKE